MITQNASDLHLKVGRPPMLRIDGELSTLDLPPLRPEDLKVARRADHDAEAGEGVRREQGGDFAIGVPGIGRFRVNVYQQRGTIALRDARDSVPGATITELNLPPVRRGDRDEAARARARHRRHRLGQVARRSRR